MHVLVFVMVETFVVLVWFLTSATVESFVATTVLALETPLTFSFVATFSFSFSFSVPAFSFVVETAFSFTTDTRAAIAAFAF